MRRKERGRPVRSVKDGGQDARAPLGVSDELVMCASFSVRGSRNGRTCLYQAYNVVNDLLALSGLILINAPAERTARFGHEGNHGGG